MTLEVGDVFGRANPTITLVKIDEFSDSRGRSELEDIVEILKLRGKIIRLFGQSKSGKTQLFRQVYSDLNPIELSGVTIEKLSDFYERLAEKFDDVTQRKKTESRIEEYCISSERPIIIDDFHRINKGTRTAIIKRVKHLTDNDVRIIFVSVPDITEEDMDNDELLMRTKPAKMPTWKVPHLSLIAQKGFAALKINMPRSAVRAMALQSYGSPFLMQEYCLRLCTRKGIRKGFDEVSLISVAKSEMHAIFQDVAKGVASYFDNTLYKRNDKRIGFTYNAIERSLTIYQLILLSISHIGVAQGIGIEKIRTTLADIVANEKIVPARPQIIEGIRELVRRSEVRAKNQSLIDYVNNKLYILHPFFKVYLMWHLNPNLLAEHQVIDWDDDQ